MKSDSVCRILTAVVFLGACAAQMPAQSYLGGVRGIVQDAGGAVVVNAKATITNDGTHVSRTTTSNGQGEYVFSQMDPATYTLTVEAQGFRKAELKGVVIATQQQLNLDVKLDVGDVATTVEVKEDVAVIETATASNGQVLDTQKLNDLPNLGRNPYLMSKLSNNVVAAGDPRFNRFQDQSGPSQISVGGGPVRGNNYLIDGIPVSDSTNRAVIIPTLESVQEMKLQVNTYDAQMGRTGGGVFNTLLKSGSNSFHGSLFGLTRQTDWVANGFFYNASGQQRPDSPFYNFGGSFGGPVRIPKIYDGRNKTFFYLTTESYRQTSPLSDGYALPTAAEKTGDFSKSTAIVYNPLTSRACTVADNCPAGVTVVRTPFAGNVIPASMINPVGAAIMSYIPAGPTGFKTDAINFTGTDSLKDRADEYTSKLDHSVFDWWRLSASYMHYKSREPGGNTLGTLPGASGNGPYLLYRKVDATAVNSVMTLNPTTVLTLRFGFNRFPNRTTGVSYGFSPAQLGFPSSYANSLQAPYFPQIGLLSNTISSTTPTFAVFYSRNFAAAVSKFVGKHSLTAGFDYRLIHVDFTAYSTAAGSFSFNGVFSREYPGASNGTGADFADLLMGFPSSGSINTTTPFADFVRYYAGFFQDDYRVTPKLTINFGIRYEYETGVQEANNHIVTSFDRTATNPIAANVTGIVPYGVIGFAGINGAPTSCCSPSKTKFGPRAGVAYQLTPKITLRGGWGMFYAPTIFSTDGTIAPGYNQVTTYNASGDGNATPANSLSNPFPTGILQPAGNSLGALTAIGSTFNVLDPKRTGGIVQQYSFDLQWQLPFGIGAEAGYVGAHSTHLLPAPTSSTAGPMDINQVPDGYLSMGSKLAAAVPNPFYGKGGAGVIGGATVAQAQLLMPYPECSTIGLLTNPASASYNSLVLKAQKRLTSGFTFLSTFTWAKNLDNEWGAGGSNAFNTFSGSTPPSQPQDVYNLAAEKAYSSIDTKFRYTSTFTYELPFGKGKKFLNGGRLLDYVVGGWQVNATMVYQSGFPLFVYQSNLNSVIGTGEQRPNVTGVSPAESGSVESRLTSYINPAAFSIAPAYTFGNSARDLPNYRGPGMKNWDASIFKDFKIFETLKGQFRAEGLNLFNSPLFANPNTQFGNAAFGKISYQTNFSRQIQLGVRFVF